MALLSNPTNDRNTDVDWGVSPYTYAGIEHMKPNFPGPSAAYDQAGVQANNTAVSSPATFGPIIVKGRTRFYEQRTKEEATY